MTSKQTKTIAGNMEYLQFLMKEYGPEATAIDVWKNEQKRMAENKSTSSGQPTRNSENNY